MTAAGLRQLIELATSPEPQIWVKARTDETAEERIHQYDLARRALEDIAPELALLVADMAELLNRYAPAGSGQCVRPNCGEAQCESRRVLSRLEALGDPL